jgi:signal peptidase I
MEIIQKNLTSINKKSKGHIKPIDLNSAQSSALSPQSLNPNPTKFEQACVELLREGYLVKFRAPGDSMYPTICDGDLITVEPIKPSDVSAGDIILYRREYGVVAHRVMRIHKLGGENSRCAPKGSRDRFSSETLQFLLRGDAAIGDDDPIRASQILGKVVSIERNGRRLDPQRLRTRLHIITRRFVSSLRRLVSSKIQSP